MRKININIPQIDRKESHDFFMNSYLKSMCYVNFNLLEILIFNGYRINIAPHVPGGHGLPRGPIGSHFFGFVS